MIFPRMARIEVGAQSCCARFDHFARESARIAANATAPNPKRGTRILEPLINTNGR